MTGSGQWGKGKMMSLFENTSNLLIHLKVRQVYFSKIIPQGRSCLILISLSEVSISWGYCLNVYILNKLFWGKTNNYLDYCWV